MDASVIFRGMVFAKAWVQVKKVMKKGDLHGVCIVLPYYKRTIFQGLVYILQINTMLY